MSNAKRCDLCGNFYQDGFGDGRSKYFHLVIKETDFMDQRVSSAERYDICPDCLVAVKNLINDIRMDSGAKKE